MDLANAGEVGKAPVANQVADVVSPSSGRGHIFAFGLFLSPLDTFRRVIRNKTTEQFSVFQLAYILLFITYVEKGKKIKMLGLLLGVFGLFIVIVIGSLQITDLPLRRNVVGILSCASLVSMFSSPLFIINLVIRTKSVEFMPFYLSLSTFLMSISFFLYGLFNYDLFVYAPNGIGTMLGSVQLVLYCYFSRVAREESREPLIVSYA
ncbi:bidirectional sugar transporter SWEET2 [Cucumis melo var. makuwa]|uniref:Bidirectional sugar transporter SWEET2 n=1 Tax=Cucumis melo var. makuwa TaxID=1194695 RepID=A0A5A7U7T3_CUCMM|nr:bidirectional sugar transporter SWEET2 [Cucumis melo var. makuwa]